MRLNRDERGFSLAEVAVASALFLFIAIAAFSVFNQSNKLYKSGDSQAEMQQRTRLAFDVMLNELRLAGFDYNRDGDENEYPDSPDEQIEFTSAKAITFRGNLDHDDGDTGRESDLETPTSDPAWGSICCPIVTTGNDEIVTYALRSDTSSANIGNIVFRVDTSAPRDAGWNNVGVVTDEEVITITNVDLVGNTPPYTLMRFAVNAAGTVTEAPVATGIRSMTFTYEGADNTEYYCTTYETDGTCASGNQVRFDALGGRNNITSADGLGRTGRAAVRSFSVALVGMTAEDERGYADKNDTLMPARRKLALTGSVVPQNLGLKGRPDIDAREAETPTNVTVCGGQCNTIRVEWDKSDRATGYLVKLFLPGATTPFFTGATPGISVADTNPPRVFAYFQRTDATQIVNGAALFARVAARMSGDRTSNDSDASSAVTLSDVTKVEEPKDPDASGYDPTVTGWPDVVTNSIAPVTTAGAAHGAQANSIIVSWTSPVWALQVTDRANPATTSVTRTGSGAYPPLDCDQEAMAGVTSPQATDYRTRARDVFGTTRYLIFRSTNPRFVPTNSDFIASTQGDVDIVAGRVAYKDKTVHVYQNGIFNRTTNALQNCMTYYYRVRAVDDCWDGTNPAGSNIHISPFSPRLNTGTGVNDSDDVTSLALQDVGLAIPGYAIPKAPPKAPTLVRFRQYDRVTTDGDGRDAVIGFDAAKMDSSTTGTGAAGDPIVPAWEDISVAQYRVYSGNSANFTLADCRALSNGTQQEAVLNLADVKAGRIAYDDENGDGAITTAEDEVLLPSPWPSNLMPRSGLRIDLGGSGSRFYKVVALQCTNENTVPSTSNPDTYDWGALSEATKFPCDFGGGPYSTFTVNSALFPSSVTCEALVEVDTVSATNARLIIKDRASGDRNMTPPPGRPVTAIGAGVYRKVFSAADIAALTDNFGTGNYQIACEMDDSNGCLGQSDSQDQILTTPACCLTSSSPVVNRITTTRISNTVTESCGIQLLRIYKITLTIDNANGSAGEKYQNVQWNGTSIWTGNATTAVIDRSTSPLSLASAQTGTLTADFSRSAVLDNVTIQYDYKIGGVSGSCSFTGRVN